MTSPVHLATSVVAAGHADLATRLSLWLAPLLPWAVGLWIAGVALHAVRLFSGWRYVNALRHTAALDLPRDLRERFEQLRERIGVSRPVVLARSALVSVPMVIGWLRPVILMPPAALAGLTPYQMELILAHELAHVRRHDYLVNLFQLVLETILFYHPMVGWLSARVRHERESCCDELVVRSGADAVRYAQALTELELLRSDGVSFAVGATDGILLARVQRLLAPPTPSPLLAVWLSGALVLSATIAGLASMHGVTVGISNNSADLASLVEQRIAATQPDARPQRPLRTVGTEKSPAPTAQEPITNDKGTVQPMSSAVTEAHTQTVAKKPANTVPAAKKTATGPTSTTASKQQATPTVAAQRQPASTVKKSTRIADHRPAPAKTPVADARTGQAVALTKTPSPAQAAMPKDTESGTVHQSADPVYTGGTPIETPKPVYPDVELSRGREGRAVLSFVVDETGRVQDVHIISSEPSSRFGFAARNAIHRWRFKPFQQDGTPVARAVTQQFDFKLPKGAGNIGCRTGSHICTAHLIDN